MSFVSGMVYERPTDSVAGVSASTMVTLGEREQDQIPLDKCTTKGQ